jgi:hypothetical protein
MKFEAISKAHQQVLKVKATLQGELDARTQIQQEETSQGIQQKISTLAEQQLKAVQNGLEFQSQQLELSARLTSICHVHSSNRK